MELNLSEKKYDFLNALVRYILPALGAAYFGLDAAWNGAMPYVTEVIGTIAVVTTFLGLVIMLARKGWKVDDELLIDRSTPGKTEFGFKSGQLVPDLQDGQTLTLNVKDVTDARRAALEEFNDDGSLRVFGDA